MAEAKRDDTKKEAVKAEGAPAEGAAAAPKRKTPMLLGGGAVGLVALGWALSMMAVPHKADGAPQHLDGPYVARLSKTEIQVNLAGESSKRYLVMMLNAEYMAYDEAYVNGRLGIAGASGGHETPVEDPLYTIQLKNALLSLASTRTREQVTDPVQIEGFLEEARRAVEPVLFPCYLGDSHSPHHADSMSGLRLGDSMSDAKMRGLLHEHCIEVDRAAKKLRFDQGPQVAFDGHERDVKLVNESGDEVWIDLSELKDGFSGKVDVGVPGRLRKIYRESFLVQ